MAILVYIGVNILQAQCETLKWMQLILCEKKYEQTSFQ